MASPNDVSELEELIHKLEFENKNYIKMIEEEDQRIEVIEAQTKDTYSDNSRLEKENLLMEDQKQHLESQYNNVKDVLANQRKTKGLLHDHEIALNKQIEIVKKEADEKSKFYVITITKASEVRQDYLAKYASLTLVKQLNVLKFQLSESQNNVSELRRKNEELRKEIKETEDFLNSPSLNNIVVKLAEAMTQTNKVSHQITMLLSAEKNTVINESIEALIQSTDHQDLLDENEDYEMEVEIQDYETQSQRDTCQTSVEEALEDYEMFEVHRAQSKPYLSSAALLETMNSTDATVKMKECNLTDISVDKTQVSSMKCYDWLRYSAHMKYSDADRTGTNAPKFHPTAQSSVSNCDRELTKKLGDSETTSYKYHLSQRSNSDITAPTSKDLVPLSSSSKATSFTVKDKFTVPTLPTWNNISKPQLTNSPGQRDSLYSSTLTSGRCLNTRDTYQLTLLPLPTLSTFAKQKFTPSSNNKVSNVTDDMPSFLNSGQHSVTSASTPQRLTVSTSASEICSTKSLTSSEAAGLPYKQSFTKGFYADQNMKVAQLTAPVTPRVELPLVASFTTNHSAKPLSIPSVTVTAAGKREESSQKLNFQSLHPKLSRPLSTLAPLSANFTSLSFAVRNITPALSLAASMSMTSTPSHPATAQGLTNPISTTASVASPRAGNVSDSLNSLCKNDVITSMPAVVSESCDLFSTSSLFKFNSIEAEQDDCVSIGKSSFHMNFAGSQSKTCTPLNSNSTTKETGFNFFQSVGSDSEDNETSAFNLNFSSSNGDFEFNNFMTNDSPDPKGANLF